MNITTLLGGIPGQFSRSLVLGTFAPVALFILATQVVLAPLLPPDISSLLRGLEPLDPQWRLVALFLFSLLLTLLLYHFNQPLIQFYEGYPWQETALGRWKIKRHERQFDVLHAKVLGMRAVNRAMGRLEREAGAHGDEPAVRTQRQAATENIASIVQDVHGLSGLAGLVIGNSTLPDYFGRSDLFALLREQVRGSFGDIELEVKSRYPISRALILPTRLGNVFRSAEEYSEREYKIDSTGMWSRLVSVIDSKYTSEIDSAKGIFDFLLNCSVMSAMTAGLVVITGIVYPAPFATTLDALKWSLTIVVFSAASWWFYERSIPRAADWGALIKGAHDLYRNDLLKQLGYERTFNTREEEKSFWDEVGLQMIYARTGAPGLPDYIVGHTYARGSPAGNLRVARGIRTFRGELVVVLDIENQADSDTATPVRTLSVCDGLPSGFEYVWASASADQGSVSVSGRDPLNFEINDIALRKSDHLIVTYRAANPGDTGGKNV